MVLTKELEGFELDHIYIKVRDLIAASDEFGEWAFGLWQRVLTSVDSDRILASYTMCGVSLEHWGGVRALFLLDYYNSGCGLVRLQFEAFVRALWISFGATDSAIDKLLNELNSESEKRANRLPLLGTMIEQLEGKAPPNAVKMVKDFRKIYWQSLNSYVHGGIHPVNRSLSGYPDDFAIEILKTSNSLVTMTTMLIAILSRDEKEIEAAESVHHKFAAILPTVFPLPAEKTLQVK